jgi:hypothetical protein
LQLGKTASQSLAVTNSIFTLSLSHAVRQLADQASQTSVEIYNVLGEKVFTETLHSVQGDNLINLSSEPSGVYFYRVLQQNGNLIGEGKIIVQK